jgi:hypothetical protein
MCIGFFIRGEKSGVEYGVNSLVIGEFQSIRVGREDLLNCKGPFAFGGEFPSWVADLEIP